MHERIAPLPAGFVRADAGAADTAEDRIVECATLAFRVAFSVLRQREDAEDVAQDALTKAHQSWRQLRDRAKLRRWIVRMAWRMAIDRRKADGRRARREEAAAPPIALNCTEAEERARQLWEAIDALPEHLRMVVVLAGIQGHDMREVSLLLGIPEGTVKSRLFEARRRMKEFLS